MEKQQFKEIRAKLNKTQKEMAQLIGTSIKAVHSYEQGWRRVPHHVERQLLFLLFRRNDNNDTEKCWDILDCPEEIRESCPAWEFHSGDLCWFINGTICSGKAHKTWQDKIEECRSCPVFAKLFTSKRKAVNNTHQHGCPVLQD